MPAFVDTNVAVHALGRDNHKKLRAKQILDASPIVAAALAADCDTLYSEDMQGGQVFGGRLTVRNPFQPS